MRVLCLLWLIFVIWTKNYNFKEFDIINQYKTSLYLIRKIPGFVSKVNFISFLANKNKYKRANKKQEKTHIKKTQADQTESRRRGM